MIDRFGLAEEVVQLVDADIPPLAPGQVRVRMQMAAINPSDLVTISGAYRSRTVLPFVGGFEGVGVVDEVHSDGPLTPGMRVMPLGSTGAWQRYKVTEAKWCFPVDDRLSDAQVATSYVNPFTAWLMTHGCADFHRSARLVLSAGKSVIALMLIRLANLQGIAPVVILRQPVPEGFFDGLDLTQLIVAGNDVDVTAELAAFGPTLALDAVGGQTGQSMYHALADGGLMVQYGLLSGQQIRLDQRPQGQVRFELFVLRNWVHAASHDMIAQTMAATTNAILEGTLASSVDHIFDLADYRAAFRHERQPGRHGKVLLRV